MMESIQLAQMLADLSDLNAAQESQAAVALVNANKTLPTSSPADSARPSEQAPARPTLRHHKRTGSGGSAASPGSSFMSRTASPAKFDKLGRRILTPPNTRTNSSYGSIPGTPQRETEVSRKPPFTTTTITTYPGNTTIPVTYPLSIPLLSTNPSHGHILNVTQTQQTDDDVDRANSLMSLYEIRAKLKDQDNNRSLSKLREKIAALHAKQVQGEKKDGDPGRAKFSYPKSP
jgi:hypothetical protein